MGSGCFMNIVNQTGVAVNTSISDVQCMFNGGDQGSNLAVFNATIPPDGQLPSGGSQYIETIDSGTCFFEASYFTLSASDGTHSSWVQIVGSASQWGWGNFNNPDNYLTIAIQQANGPGTQARITLYCNVV